MNIRYELLTEVQFEHEYYNGLFSAFKVKPSAGCLKLLGNFGMEFREKFGRFFILFDVLHGGIKRSRKDILESGLHLIFSLELTDTSIFNYTAPFNMDFRKAVFYFSNSKIEHTTLHKGDLVSNKDIYSFPLRFFPEDGISKPFGKIILQLSSGLLSTYVIRFEALATYWRYILMSDYLTGISNPVVTDKSSQIIFNGPKSINLPSGVTRSYFVSTRPIKLSSKPITNLQLLDHSSGGIQNSRVIIRTLQNPNYHYISSLPTEEDIGINIKYSEIIL